MLELCHKTNLYKELDLFNFNDPPIDPVELKQQLHDAVKTYNGMGLSANQLGLDYRVFVLNSNPFTICFNPRIVRYSEDFAVLEESCLTFPELRVKIRRPEWIRVRFQDETGKVHTESLQGLPARVFQHELDHLDGINYLDRANKIHLDQAKRKSKIFNRKMKRVKKYV